MPDRLITPATRLSGAATVPGDKSISHRALLLAAIAEGDSEMTGLSKAQDVRNTRECLEKLGVKIVENDDRTQIQGLGMYGLKPTCQVLEVGNSGTTIRLLAGILAAQNFTSKLDGDESIRKRPMRRIIEPLELMGAKIDSDNFRAPLTIIGGPLQAIDFASPIASAQVKSCIIFAGLYAKGLTRVTEPTLSRDHTTQILQEFGATIRQHQTITAVQGPAQLRAARIDVPADISSAAFFLIAGSILSDSKILLPNVGINPTRTGIMEVLIAMNASISASDQVTRNYEPRATLQVRSAALQGTTISGTIIPRLIDEIPILAVAATQAQGVTTIRDAAELRVKESDRIAAIVENLTRMGASVREKEDGMVISGPTPLIGAEIESFGDHRIAMAFAVAGLVASGETLIKNVACVDTSFPGFFDLIDSLRHD